MLPEAAGYSFVTVDYPSRTARVEDLVAYMDDAVAQCGDETLNFITHSLGGILVRGWMMLNDPPNMGRVVMLGPPNGGSELVDAMGDIGLYRYMTGPAGSQLGTDAAGIAAQLPLVDFEVGVIAGNQSTNPVFSRMIPGPDDGKVSVESTKVEGMTDHIVLPVTHTFLMNNPLMIAQLVIFLQTGAFRPDLTYGELMRRGCQTDSNQSQLGVTLSLCRAETAPLGESCGTVLLEIGSGGEAAVGGEVIGDGAWTQANF